MVWPAFSNEIRCGSTGGRDQCGHVVSPSPTAQLVRWNHLKLGNMYQPIDREIEVATIGAIDSPTMEEAIQAWIAHILARGDHMSSILPPATTEGIAERKPENKRPITTPEM